MREDLTVLPNRRRHRARIWVARALVAVGTTLLAGVALSMLDSRLAQQRAQALLDAVPQPVLATEHSARPLVLPRGAAIGRLSLPRVQLSAVVLQGSVSRTLRRGPGHIESTPLPGETGNVAVAGHRDSFFRSIRHVQVGDDVFLDTAYGQFQYSVTSLKVVRADDVSVLEQQAAGSTLTLITCYPFLLVGPAPDRFVVLATEVARPRGVETVARVSATQMLDEPPPAPVVARGRSEHLDDESRVRQAIERFRVTYNARLERRPGPVSSAPLVLAGCDVDLQDGEATAACASRSAPTDGARAWIFRLRSTSAVWSIVSVEPQ